jgi:hypothetical protein
VSFQGSTYLLPDVPNRTDVEVRRPIFIGLENLCDHQRLARAELICASFRCRPAIAQEQVRLGFVGDTTTANRVTAWATPGARKSAALQDLPGLTTIKVDAMTSSFMK